MDKLHKRFSFDQILVLCLLFLASMNVFEKYFYFIFVAFGVTLLANRKLKANIGVILLLIFSLIYVLTYPEARSSWVMALKQFAYPICFMIGLNIVTLDERPLQSVRDGERIMTFSIFVIALGSLSHFLLNMMTNVGSLTRNTIDIWSGRTFSATGQAAMAVLALSVFVVGLVGQSSWMWKIVSTIGCVLIFLYNLVLSGRLLLLLCGVLVGEAIVFTMLQASKKHFIRRFIILIALLFLIYIIISFNLFGITERFGGSNLAQRFETTSFWEDIRMTLKGKYLSLLFTYPFGGGAIKKRVGMYAHDILLDAYSDTGIIGCLILLGILIVSVMQLAHIVRNKMFSVKFRLLILCTYSAMFFIFFCEPILSGMQWLFCAFCFFQGIISRISRLHISSSEEVV